jgi:hypothetical protein
VGDPKPELWIAAGDCTLLIDATVVSVQPETGTQAVAAENDPEACEMCGTVGDLAAAMECGTGDSGFPCEACPATG